MRIGVDRGKRRRLKAWSRGNNVGNRKERAREGIGWIEEGEGGRIGVGRGKRRRGGEAWNRRDNMEEGREGIRKQE